MARLRRARLRAAVLAACALLVHCTHRSRVVLDHLMETPSSVGPSAPRLAFLPVVLQASPSNRAYCIEACWPDRERTEIAVAAMEHLSARLGYDVLCADPACEPPTGVMHEELDRWASALRS